MAITKKEKMRKERRLSRVRSRVKRNNTLPRVSVFRSLKHVYAQVIDDTTHTTITSFSSAVLPNHDGDKKEVAHRVGLELAKLAKAKGIESVIFDRGHLLYHGRIKALADGLREGGLKL